MNFNVNGTQWKVVFCNQSSNNLKRSDGSITIGMCDNNAKCVYINENLNEYMTDKVLCHELTHVFSFEYGLTMDIETEEIVADFMSLYGRQIIYLLDDITNILLRKVA